MTLHNRNTGESRYLGGRERGHRLTICSFITSGDEVIVVAVEVAVVVVAEVQGDQQMA